MAEVNPPFALQTAGIQHPAKLFRRMLQGMLAEGLSATVTGVSTWPFGKSGDLAVSQRGAGANMSVDVAKGGVYVFGDDSTDQGMYYMFSDAVVNKVISAADPTNPRIDIVVARVKDNTEGQAGDTWLLDVIAGTPAGSPSPPATPNTAFKLAQVAVAAAASSITNANITDFRYMATTSLLNRITPSVKVVRAATLSMAVGYHVVNWNSELWDTDGFHDNATNNSRITIPNGMGGKYLVQASATGNGAVDWTAASGIGIVKNGAGAGLTPIAVGGRALYGGSSFLRVDTAVDLAAGDYVEAWVDNESAGAISVAAGETGGYFSAVRIA